MLDGLNKYGLPVKYGILGLVGGILGAFLSKMFGYGDGYIITLSMPISAGIGGAIGGWLRQRQGKNS